jgi:hypothetical protein
MAANTLDISLGVHAVLPLAKGVAMAVYTDRRVHSELHQAGVRMIFNIGTVTVFTSGSNPMGLFVNGVSVG